ncbi:MAG: RAD55 family ATPase [Pyrobaculum sp.]
MGFRSGVEPLDSYLPEGLPEGFVVLIEGPLGVGKTFFVYNMAASAARAGAPVLIFSIDAIIDDAVGELERRGAPLEKVVVVDGFAAPGERYVKLKPTVRHRLDTPDAHMLVEKLAEFSDDFRKGVVIVDSLNEVVMRSPGSALEVFRAFKIFAKYTSSVVMTTVHTDVEEIRSVVTAVKHLADMVIELGVDPNLEEVGLYMRRMRIVRARKMRVPHDWIHYEITEGKVVEIDVKAMLKIINRQLAELGAR